MKELEDGWIVEVSAFRIRFASVGWPDDDGKARRRAAGRCSPLILDEWGTDIALSLGDVCLVGHHAGEFGGDVSVYDPRSRTRERLVRYAHPKRFVVAGDGSVLVLEGLAHFMDSGNVRRVRRLGDGRWTTEAVVGDLGGNPMGWTREAEGTLLLLVREQDKACSAEPSYVVLRVGPGRRVEALE
ncbi:MAG: hypothetical protein KF819_04045 [Labilithrix sp.]|nr:hypothetical protein [Labilithrix sp.]